MFILNQLTHYKKIVNYSNTTFIYHLRDVAGKVSWQSSSYKGEAC
jgi:hypothetical protein